MHVNDAPQTPGVHLALFADDTCIYVTDRKEGCVLRKLQRGLIAMETWCETWNITINEDKTQTIYFSHRRRPVEAHIELKGRKIPFVNEVKHFGAIFDRKVTWRCPTDSIATTAHRTFVRLYFLLKSERLSAKPKLTLYKDMITSKMIYTCPAWEFSWDSHLLKLQRLQNIVLRTTGNISRRTPTHVLHLAFQIPYVYNI
jgi:hypothetical protein